MNQYHAHNAARGKFSLLVALGLAFVLMLALVSAAFAAPNDSGNQPPDRIFNGRTGPAAKSPSVPVMAPHIVIAATIYVRTDGDDANCNGEAATAYPGSGSGLTCAVKTIQKGIDLVNAGGTVYVYPGAYSETAAGRSLYDSTGPYQFGLFFGVAKPGITVQGVKTDGTAITAYADVATIVTTNATNSFGYSGVFVEADSVTMVGLGIGPNTPSDNKTIEVIGNNFTLKASHIDVPDGGSVYLGDFRYDAGTNTSHIQTYTVEGNWLDHGTSVDVTNGAGYTGVVSGRKIINNKFSADSGAYWALISFSGSGTGVPWYVYSVGGTVITGNQFSGGEQYIRSRGTVINSQFDWASYWGSNTFDRAVLNTTDGNPANVRTYSYTGSYGTMNDVRRIGATISKAHSTGCVSNDCNGEIGNAQAGDTVLVAAGTYNESPTLNKSLTLKSTGGRDATTINLQTVPNYTGSMLISGQTVTVDGFTINGYDAVGSGPASTNVYVKYPATNVLLTNNRFKIGQIGSGTTGDDGIGVITEYNLSNAIASLIVTDNIFMPLNAQGQRAFYINPDVNQFTFKGNEITGKFVGRAISEAKDNLIENNTITGVGAAGSRSAGIGVWGYIDPAVYGKATIRGNTISGVATGISIFSANNVTVEQNTISQVGVGVKVQESGAAFDPSLIEIHKNKFNSADTFAVENATATMVDAENNWWGSACGPGPVGPGSGAGVSTSVDYSPWWADASGGGTASEGAGGSLVIPAGATTAQQQAIINCAAGKTVTYAGIPMAGGVVINTNGVTINLNGATVGAGSSAYTINADDVIINGPGTLDGNGSSDPAIRVNAGADNFILNGVEIREWADGVQVAGSVISLKLVNNWIHSNTDAGLQVDSGATLGGVVTIEGNLFKVNGVGVRHDGAGTLMVENNSWGHVTAPATPADYSGVVDADPWTFAETYIDVDPIAGGDQYIRGVNESTSFNVDLRVEAANLYGLAFQFTYDPTYLTLNGAPTFDAPWVGNCAVVDTPPSGTCAYRCSLTSGSVWNGGKVATFNFTANGTALTGNGPWTTYFDVSSVPAATNAGAIGGVKVFVNNAGFNAPSAAARDITDTNDGQINITGIAKFIGFVDLQGRANDSGGTVSVYNQLAKSGATLLASGASVSSGSYTTNYIGSNLLTIGTTYYFQVDRALYLPTTQMFETAGPPPVVAPTDWAHLKLLNTRATTSLANVVLLGGDATNDNIINVNDATCIGGGYNKPPATCGSVGGTSSDVNEDGVVDILDLVLMGGNYDKTASTWTP